MWALLISHLSKQVDRRRAAGPADKCDQLLRPACFTEAFCIGATATVNWIKEQVLRLLELVQLCIYVYHTAFNSNAQYLPD